MLVTSDWLPWNASSNQDTACWWPPAKEDRLVQLRADCEDPEVGSCLDTPVPGITFEPLLCGRYWVYARVPTFPGITEHAALISPAGKLGLTAGRGTLHPHRSLGRSQQEQGSDNVRVKAVITRREGIRADLSRHSCCVRGTVLHVE